MSTSLRKTLVILAVPFLVLAACTKEEWVEDQQADLVAEDRLKLDVSAFPLATLGEYRFFKGPMADQRPVPGVLPYVPINALFSDYAHKFRFVWMPPGVKAVYNGDHEVLDFPDGTVLIKTFYYDNVLPTNTRRIIETRLLFKRNGLWEFADYIWNEQQTEATLDLEGGYLPLTWIDDNGAERSLNYRIPSEAECLTCHKSNDLAVPIGPKPRNLNSDLAYADGTENQLTRWTRSGYLHSVRPKHIRPTPDWQDESLDLNTRVRAYVDINCAHCHREDSHCDYRPVRFAFEESGDPANLGICVPPDDPLLPQHSHIVARGSVGRSLMHYRLASVEENVRMPLLGRSVVHEEGLSLITDWINSLAPACP